MLRTNKDSIEYAIKPLFRIRSRYTGPSHWEKIFHSKSPKFYAKGDVIVSQGEDNQNIFYIDMGLVEYTYTDKTGAENLIEVLGEGNMLNLQPVFGKNPSIATFFALTDSKLYALSATEVREHMMKDKFLVEELLEEMAIVIGGLNRQSCISTEKSNSRLLQILFMLAASSLALNTGFQILDRAFMEEDEYDEFLSDPSHFLMTKVFPRRHKNLAALSKIGFRNIFSAGHFASMQPFSDPDVIEAFLTLAAAGKQMKQWNAGVAYLSGVAAEMQTTVANQAGQLAPYDMLADMLRGYLNVPMDLFLIPDKVEAAIGVMETIAMQSAAQMKQRGVEFCFMPLHGGTDDFMSDETYRKYYWPSLQRVIEKLISFGITPYVFCEGKYNTRLDVIKEVPKGKVIYMFEQVDIVKAKETLRDVACIGGNVPGAALVFGKKEDVVEETKRMIDACAPGGGFIMDCSIVLDHYNEEVFEAWYDTTMNFGKY